MIYCPGCGQGLRFDIATQMMVCPSCDGTYDPATTGRMSKDAHTKPTFDSYIFTCPSCGGELLTTDEHDAVGFCPFCGGASMLFDRVHQQWEPQYIIPFQITKEQCKELYEREARRSIFTSKLYRDPKLIEGFRGIYMPYWNYQAIQKGSYHLKGEKKGFFVKKTYRITGNTDVELDGYGHDASQNFDDRISEHIAPFDPRGHKPFAPGYLSGFYADVGDVNAHAYDQKATDSIRENTARLLASEKAITSSTGGIRDIEVDVKSAQIPTELVSAQRTLYPVWFMSYRNKDKITYAAVNGQTGKVSADLPVSPWKILLTVLITGVLIAAGLFFLPSVKANAALIVSIALLIIGTIVLRVNYAAAVGPETGLSETQEAKRFKKSDRWRLLSTFIVSALGVLTAWLDPAYNVISYLGCLLMAGMLFYNMLSHIRFQAQIAKRQPPQFRKKGAAYDEN